MKKKLEMDVERLDVQSFATEAAAPAQGTVHGAEVSAPDPCLPDTSFTCARRQTLYASCVANCECTNGLRACIGAASQAC